MHEAATEPFLAPEKPGDKALYGRFTLIGSAVFGVLLGSSSVILAMEKVSPWAAKTHASMPSLLAAETVELTYFNIPCRGEITRMALHAGDVPFKDTRIGAPDWPSIQSNPNSLPSQMFSALPIITKGSYKLAESAIVAAYAAELGMNTKHSPSVEEKYFDMMVLTAREDIMAATVPTFEAGVLQSVFSGSKPACVTACAPFPEPASRELEVLNRFLTQNPGPFLYKPEESGPSVGDLAIYDIATNKFPDLSGFYSVDFSKYPAIEVLVKAIEDSEVYPGLKAYLKSRTFDITTSVTIDNPGTAN